ncbi:MAG: GNAT family N-acetyltransferase [Caulobacteraceae bacterium]
MVAQPGLAMTPAEAFAADFHRRAPGFALSAATAADAPFLRRLFLATEAEANPLPAALLEMQHESRLFAYAAQFPAADDVIVQRDGAPIGRMMIDWTSPNGFHAIDLAVLPGQRSGAAGLHLLRAWVGTADRFSAPATLSVRPGAPVAALYRRLGFTALDDGETPIRMRRAPLPRLNGA